jgi:hypothetical protein
LKEKNFGLLFNDIFGRFLRVHFLAFLFNKNVKLGLDIPGSFFQNFFCSNRSVTPGSDVTLCE